MSKAFTRASDGKAPAVGEACNAFKAMVDGAVRLSPAARDVVIWMILSPQFVDR